MTASSRPARRPPVLLRRGTPAGPLFAVLLGLVGAALVIVGADEGYRVLPTLSWPTAPGEVTQAQVTQDTVGVEVGRHANRPIVVSRFHLTYTYRVGERTYRGQQLDLLPPGRRNPVADRQRYPIGTHVTVRYAPTRPEHAVLEARWPRRALVTLIGGLLLLGAAWRLRTNARDRWR